MIFHFNTRQLAEAHLRDNGWTEGRNGVWISRDKTCRATIVPAHGEIVAVSAEEIPTA